MWIGLSRERRHAASESQAFPRSVSRSLSAGLPHPDFLACFVWKPNAVLSSCYWLMEALRGTNFAGTQTLPSGEEHGEDHPLSQRRCMSERDTGSIDRGDTDSGGHGTSGVASAGADGGDDGEELERDGNREGGAARKSFFEFYPFLNDPAHNEMDGEAR